MYSVQKEQVEVKSSVNSLMSSMGDTSFVMKEPRQQVMLSPRTGNNLMFRQSLEDSQEIDSDEEYREKIISHRAHESDSLDESRVTIPKIEDVKIDKDKLNLQEITYQELKQLIIQILGEDEDIGESYEMVIDCSNKKHQTLLEILSSKAIPRLSLISMQNIENGQE